MEGRSGTKRDKKEGAIKGREHVKMHKFCKASDVNLHFAQRIVPYLCSLCYDGS
jgi:hypothetical protein